MKKIISIVLCTVMLLMSALIPVGAVEKQPSVELVGNEIYIPANKVLVTAYNLENETNYLYYVYLEESDNDDNSIRMDFYNSLKNDKLYDVKSCEYKLYKGTRNSMSGYRRVSFNEGAYYQKIRIKVCDFYKEGYTMSYQNGELIYDSKYGFKDNGDYYYYHYEKGDFNFNFTNVEKVQESGMFVVSGSAITAVKPDKNGMIEFYVKKELADSPYLSGSASEWEGITEFGTSFGDNLKLSVGDIDLSKKIDVSDATIIQKYCAGLIELSDAQKFFADANCDGTINVSDSTAIQKYCVK